MLGFSSFLVSRVYDAVRTRTDYKVGQCFKVDKTWDGLIGIKKITEVFFYGYNYSILQDGKYVGKFNMRKDAFNRIHSLTNCQ